MGPGEVTRRSKSAKSKLKMHFDAPAYEKTVCREFLPTYERLAELGLLSI